MCRPHRRQHALLGANGSGVLGDGTTTSSNVPISPLGLVPPGVSQTAANVTHTCAVSNDGRVRCWGNNASGRLGDGTKTNSTIPVAVVGIP